jgi:glycosyltransferase involved in cell wall biosynthesis
MPKVSIVIPTCNRPFLLNRAIRSVLAQTYQDFEVIVVDDGVKESAEHVVLAVGDSRIRYIKNETSLGGGGTRNRGITEAQGEYVAFLDDDDEWLPEKLAKHAAAYETSGREVGVVFNGVSFTGNPDRSQLLPDEHGVVDVLARTLYRCYIWTSALSARRTLLLEEGFDQTFPKNQEWDLEIRLAQQAKFFAINEPLTVINILGEHEHMGGKGNLPNIIKGFELLLSKHAALYRIHPKGFARQTFKLGTLYREHGDHAAMRSAFFRAWRATPGNLTYARHALAAMLGKGFYERTRRSWQSISNDV